MRKRFLHDEYGQEETFWAKNWDRYWDKKYTSPPSVDKKLVRHIKKYLIKNMLILEGGCGDCQYVRYLTDLGHQVVGVDFAKSTVAKVNKLLPDLDIRVGDITDIDFPDNYFDVYYSGGVIEHFEEGVEKQLAEARRVLKNGGYFFVTVPHMNIFRKITAFLRDEAYTIDMDGRKTFHKENIQEFKKEIPPSNFHFHEYVFTTAEMHGFLEQYNLNIVEEVGFSAAFGLLDMEFYRKLVGVGKDRRSFLNKMFAGPLRLIRKLDSWDFWAADLISNVYGEFAGNLKLYVCKVVK